MKGAASAAWVKAEYDTVKTANFLTYGDAMASGEEPLLVGATLVDDSVKKHEASVRCTVLAFGPGATSATVKLLYWMDGAATTNTVDVGSLTEKGSLTANLTGLLPQTAYCAKVVVMNNAETAVTEESSVVTFTTDTYLPSDSIALDGVGGDTITVSGTVEAFDASKTCALTVLTGASEDSLSNEWSELAGSTLSASADSTEQKFSFSLCETDTTSTRYIAPGSTVYVAVKATIGDWVMQSPAKAVTTANTASQPTPTMTTDQRTLTLTGMLSDLGMTGKTSVSLWRQNAETGAYEQEGEAQEIASTEDSYSFETRGAEFGTNYNFKVRATNISAGKTATNSVESAEQTFTPVDRATYTWSGRGTSGVWEDAANWSNNKGGDCQGWPKAAGASVDFATGSDVEILFTNSYSIANLYLTNVSANVTFKNDVVASEEEGATTTIPTLTVGTLISLSGTNNVFTIDGMGLASASVNSITLGSNSTWKVVNGASVLVNPDGNNTYNKGGKILVEDAKFECTRYHMSQGAETQVKSVAGTATFTARGQTRWNSTDAANPDTIRIEGANASYTMGWANYAIFAPGKADAILNLDFVVPRGGWTAAPLTATSAPSTARPCGYFDAAGKVKVNLVAGEASSKTVTTPLVSWPNAGIARSYFELGDSTKKSSQLIWKDKDGVEVDETVTRPIQLWGELPGSAGLLLIIR